MISSDKMPKIRLIYLSLTLILIPIGLATRQYDNEFLKLYAGDVLWAATIYWSFKFLFIQDHKITAFYALIFCFSIEFSQLYHESWIDYLLNTRFGSLVLGFGFLWTDLVCYSVSVLGIYWGDKIFNHY